MLHFNADFTRILAERVTDRRLDPDHERHRAGERHQSFKDEIVSSCEEYDEREIDRRLRNSICDYRIFWRLSVYTSVAGRGATKGNKWDPSSEEDVSDTPGDSSEGASTDSGESVDDKYEIDVMTPGSLVILVSSMNRTSADEYGFLFGAGNPNSPVLHIK
eukprot:gene5130-6241_t